MQKWDASVYSSAQQEGAALSSILLEGALSSCPSALDMLVHPVSWGSPSVLRRQLLRVTDLLTPDDLCIAFEEALISAMRTRTADTLECVTVLLDAGVKAEGIGFNTLCDSSFDRYSRVEFGVMHEQLLKKLNLASLDDIKPIADEAAVMTDPTTPVASVRSASKYRRSRISKRYSTKRIKGLPSMRTMMSSFQLGQAGSGPPMAIGADGYGAENALGFYTLAELVGNSYRTHLRARSRIGGSFLDVSFDDLGVELHAHTMADCVARSCWHCLLPSDLRL
jgi:hypothetical protein